MNASASRIVAIMLAIFLITGASTCFVTQCLGQTQNQPKTIQSPFSETTLTILPTVVAAPVVSNDSNARAHVNPKAEKILNSKAYPSVKEIPGKLDLVVIAVLLLLFHL